MASQSDTQKVQKVVAESLDQANASLTESQRADITQARLNAIKLASQQKPSQRWLGRLFEKLKPVWLLQNYHLAAPAAVAVIVAVLVSYNQVETVPAIPAELMLGEVPLEELALLEDLEFASWLAEQEQKGAL